MKLSFGRKSDRQENKPRVLTGAWLISLVSLVRRCVGKSAAAPTLLKPEQRVRRMRGARAASEALEPRIVLTTLNYTVDIANVEYALTGGTLDGDVDLTLRVADGGNGSAVLQLVDVDRGNLVVGTAPFTEDIQVNITGYQTQIEGKTVEFQESLLIDLSNATGFSPAAVAIGVDFDGIKGVVPMIEDTVTIAPSGGSVYSPGSLNVMLTNGDAITVSGALPAVGDVQLTSDGKIVVTGSVTAGGNISLTAAVR